MYGIVTRVGRGSWQMATSRVFDDKEKAQASANGMKQRGPGAVYCVVYMGDAEDWKENAR